MNPKGGGSILSTKGNQSQTGIGKLVTITLETILLNMCWSIFKYEHCSLLKKPLQEAQRTQGYWLFNLSYLSS